MVARSAAATSSKIRVCSVCHKNGHTKRNCPELANFGKHDVPVERVETAPVVVVTGERSLDERLKADRAKAEHEGRVVDLTEKRSSSGDAGYDKGMQDGWSHAVRDAGLPGAPPTAKSGTSGPEYRKGVLKGYKDAAEEKVRSEGDRPPSHTTKDHGSDSDDEEGHVVRRAEQWRNHLREGGERDRAAWDRHFGDTDKEHQNKILQRVRGHDN